MNKNYDLLNKIYACVVKGKEQAYFHCVESSNPEDVGKIIFPPSPAVYRVYLVNESDCDIKSVEVYTGGFDGSDDELIELNSVTKDYGAIQKGGFLLLEELDFGLLDFVLWYELTLNFADGRKLKATFNIFKAHALKEDIHRYSPILKEKAYYFTLEEQKL